MNLRTKTCRTCGVPVTSKKNKTGLCKPCARKDPEVAARKSAAVRARYLADPEFRELQRARTAEHNRSEKMRALAGQKARELRIWEKGIAAMTPELRQQSAKRLSETRMAHIPPEVRDDYRVLVRAKVPKEEALATVLALHEERMKDFRRKLEEASL